MWVRPTNNDGGYEYVSLGKVDRETSRQKYIARIPVPNPDGPKKTKQVNVTGGPFYSALDAAVAAAKAMRDLPPLPKASRAPRGTKRERCVPHAAFLSLPV